MLRANIVVKYIIDVDSFAATVSIKRFITQISSKELSYFDFRVCVDFCYTFRALAGSTAKTTIVGNI